MSVLSVFIVGCAIFVVALAGYMCGRLHEQYVRDQTEPERPADWAQELAHRDPQRLVNLFREGRFQ
jgi:hypothetical protein